MKLAVLTSRSLRHHYYLDALAQRHELVAVVRETKRDLVEASASDEPAVLREHLAERDAAERRYFGAHEKPACDPLLDVPAGEANSQPVHQLLCRRDPDALLLFGTSIIEPPILSQFAGRIVNLHLGLSPYYRGSASLFWPLVNGEPECIGATIHHATRRVDAGAVLHQVRPELEPGDGAHDIGCKTLIAGARGVLAVLSRAQRDGLAAGLVQSTEGGRLYRRRDFSAKAVQRLRANLASGMLPAYLAARSQRDAARPIVTLGRAQSGQA